MKLKLEKIEQGEDEVVIRYHRRDKKIERIINFVKGNEGVTIPEIEMYTDCSRAVVNTLIKNGYLELIEKKIERNPLKDKKIQKTDNLTLTEEQRNAYEKVEISIEEKRIKYKTKR